MINTFKIPKITNPNQKTRLIVYLKPDIKERIEQRAKMSGISTTKLVEKLIRQGLGI